MQKGLLIKTNPYLKDAAEREALLTAAVVSSTAIEGVHLSGLSGKKPSKKTSRITECHEPRASCRSRR